MDNERGQLQKLQQKLPRLSEDLQSLSNLLGVDIPSSLNKIRFITEKILYRLSKDRNVSWGQAEPTLERMIGPLVAAECIPKNIAIHVRTVQTNTSPGSHYQESALSDAHVRSALNALVAFLAWYAILPQEDAPTVSVEADTTRGDHYAARVESTATAGAGVVASRLKRRLVIRVGAFLLLAGFVTVVFVQRIAPVGVQVSRTPEVLSPVFAYQTLEQGAWSQAETSFPLLSGNSGHYAASGRS